MVGGRANAPLLLGPSGLWPAPALVSHLPYGLAVKQNNWPPLPSFCPMKPCFYQDIPVEIPMEFQKTVSTMYYLWMGELGWAQGAETTLCWGQGVDWGQGLGTCLPVLTRMGCYSCEVWESWALVSHNPSSAAFLSASAIALFLNFVASLAWFCVEPTAGSDFGLSILWALLYTPCSFVCWYRPMYKAFRYVILQLWGLGSSGPGPRGCCFIQVLWGLQTSLLLALALISQKPPWLSKGFWTIGTSSSTQAGEVVMVWA